MDREQRRESEGEREKTSLSRMCCLSLTHPNPLCLFTLVILLALCDTLILSLSLSASPTPLFAPRNVFSMHVRKWRDKERDKTEREMGNRTCVLSCSRVRAIKLTSWAT